MNRKSESCQKLSIKVETSFFCSLCHAELARVSTKVPSETEEQKTRVCHYLHTVADNMSEQIIPQGIGLVWAQDRKDMRNFLISRKSDVMGPTDTSDVCTEEENHVQTQTRYPVYGTDHST